MTHRFVIGIDLGTTNSVLAYAGLSEEAADIRLLPLPQLVAPSTVESRPSLPSFLYLAADHEQGSGAFDLPWSPPAAPPAAPPADSESTGTWAAGHWARDQSAASPDRTVGAAKSWLAHSAVDRHAAILPWQAPDEVPKVSPVTASQRYLEHLVAAWNQQFPDAPFYEQQIVLTVPASFDASACELTRLAAYGAGFPASFVLLEEPQAAVYAWLADRGDAWRKELKVGERLLVCDIGGGTTDLTLVGVAEEDGQLTLQRIAVGKHLLVGGDNMDLALAHHAAEQFQQRGTSLDPWQAVSLWHACRAAKESLLTDAGPDHYPVSVLGRSSRLVGGTVTTDLQRDAVASLLVDGFFPACELVDRPARRRQSGFVQLGLPFESDTAITRHIAAFLSDHALPGESAAQPAQVLFNGGVFRAAALRQRLLETLGHWFPQQPPRELAGQRDLDFAVARGAACYGWSKQHGGLRIRGGTARSYYIGIETAGLAIPGAARPLKALCVVPFGMEEGTQIDVPASETGLVLGEPVQFRFFSSSTRKHDVPGQSLTRWTEDELQETDSLETTLPPGAQADEDYVPVRLQSRVNELGVFELWCVSTVGDDRWKLEFNVREE
jgi:molecular chaperone DnaK (HSP70)